MADIDLLVPEGARLLHIGLPKTGTTTIQGALKQARPALRGHGVVYPGKDRQHWRAARAVLGTPGPKGDPPVDPRCWDRLVGQVSAAGGHRVVVSAEAFSAADDDGARTVVRGLGGSAVHVVVTLRPLAKMLPSIWQQSVRQSLRDPYETWLKDMLETSRAENLPRFWRRHRQDVLVERWAGAVGAENVTVVVVDESDREMLMRVFERMLGLPSGLLRPESRTNPSLSFGEVEFVRLLNCELHRRGWSSAQHRAWVRLGVVHHLQGCERPVLADQRIQTPCWAAEHIAELGAATAESISATGVRVVGDIAALGSRPASSSADPGSDAPPAADPLVLAETAAQAVVGAVLAGRKVAERRSGGRKALGRKALGSKALGRKALGSKAVGKGRPSRKGTVSAGRG